MSLVNPHTRARVSAWGFGFGIWGFGTSVPACESQRAWHATIGGGAIGEGHDSPKDRFLWNRTSFSTVPAVWPHLLQVAGFGFWRQGPRVRSHDPFFGAWGWCMGYGVWGMGHLGGVSKPLTKRRRRRSEGVDVSVAFSGHALGVQDGGKQEPPQTKQTSNCRPDVAEPSQYTKPDGEREEGGEEGEEEEGAQAALPAPAAMGDPRLVSAWICGLCNV